MLRGHKHPLSYLQKEREIGRERDEGKACRKGKKKKKKKKGGEDE